MFIENPSRTDALIEQLTAVWEASVKATHTFLGEEDISSLRPIVKSALLQIKELIVAYKINQAVGFMGIAQEKLEMLFLEPNCIGKGIGKAFISKAKEEYSVKYVDVNEQNPHAVEFYKHAGFTVFERTERDEQGNTFPILKMKRVE